MSIRADTIRMVKNLPGKKTCRRIVCIYVDDYGSIRVKDRAAYKALLEAGVPMDSNRYSKFDTLASTEDMQMMYDVLTSVTDSRGCYACLTPFANIANPDFDKIKESGFITYYREPFTETLKRYGPLFDGVYDLWKQGIVSHIFHPEYHGTEHINVKRFMDALKGNNKTSRLAFDNECVAVPPLPDTAKVNHETAVFYIEKAEENESLKADVRVGCGLFEQLFGFRPRQFTPGAGIYSPALHEVLKEEGIDYINVQRYRSYPLGDGKDVKRFLYNGKENDVGQKYVVRNCAFEPYLNDCRRNENAVADCLKSIETAFRMHAPAIISSHRVNYVGSLESAHRDDSLKQLRLLLTEIVKRWPDVEFMDGTQMCDTCF